MTNTAVLVINACTVLATMDRDYDRKWDEWQSKCISVRAGFHKKTSRKEKNGKVYEYTNWYKEKSGGGLESVGKIEPDYSKYYPPEPKPRYSFKFQDYDGHVLLEESDYNANQALFMGCLAFRLEDCRNLNHPLYRDPQKAVNSVQKGGMSSERSPRRKGQNGGNCWNDGDCDSCEHNDECPVME